MFERLPEYPWQKLNPYREIASSHPDGLIDLSVGSPVDDTPRLIQNALTAAANAPGYPATWGEPQLRDVIVEWYARRRGVSGLTQRHVTPTIGSKEFISWLPLMLGLGQGDVVVQPRLAYTAYEVGAKFANAEIFTSDDPAEWPESTKLIWLNSPGNPDGAVAEVETLRRAVHRARQLGAVIVNDECYAELAWEVPWHETATPCILHPDVTGGNLTNILSIYSLSKQSNLAGYRAAFAAGDERLIAALVNLRMHSGMITPLPVQRAMAAALSDEAHVQQQREIYGSRRSTLLSAVKAAGFVVDRSEAGLYIWATKGQDCWQQIRELAEMGILAVPGEFYGRAGSQHVRFSVTATDQQISAASKRLLNALG